MEITYAHSGPAVFFLVEGSLTVDADLQGLRAAVCGIADPKVRGVFLDLARVTRLDCSGIGELTRLHRLVSASGRTFGLVHVGRRDRRMLEMVGLGVILLMHDNVRQAIESLPAIKVRHESRGPHLLSCDSVSVGS